MRLIDADDLKDLMFVALMGYENGFIRGIENVIDDCPTIDAVPVVRCKDCVSYVYSGNYIDDDDGEEKEFWYCDFHSLPNNSVQMQSNSFCSYGERKEG